jgi:predicted ribosomally synthesized peptide with SipW-like signal peptide
VPPKITERKTNNMAISHTRARRVKGLIAGACGAALLLAGGTWALWYDEEHVDGGWITAGNLDLAKAGDEVVYDISNLRGVNDTTHVWEADDTGYRTDSTVTDFGQEFDCIAAPYSGVEGHEADLANGWTASPGDTLLSVWPYYVALQGDNLVAEIKIEAAARTTPLPGQNPGDIDEGDYVDSKVFSEFKALIRIKKADGTWATESVFDSTLYAGLPDKADRIKAFLDALIEGQLQERILLQAENESAGTADASTDPVIYEIGLKDVPNPIPGDPKAANACVVFEGTFDPGTTGQEYVKDQLLKFPTLDITLEQTREPGLGNF